MFFANDISGGNKCKHDDSMFYSDEVGFITLGKVTDKGSADEHTDININNRLINIMLLHPKIVESFNKGEYIGKIYGLYGITGWQMSEIVNLTGLATETESANENFNIGKILPDIFQVSKITVKGKPITVLKTGDQGGDKDANGRPMTLGTIYLKKIN